MAELRYVDWDGLVYYDGKIKEYIRDKAEDYLKMGGVLPIKNLPDPSWQNLNYIYKITDEFTSNDRFEKPGYVYPAGTWVQCVNSKEDERWLYIIFNEETIGETADLSDYYTKSEVEDKIQDAIDSLSSEIDLGNYYTKDEVDTLIPDDFATQSDISILDEAVANIQATIDEQEETLKTKADKSELNSLATKKELEDAINSIEHPTVDLTGYATEEYVDNAIENIPPVDLSAYAKTAEVDVKLDAKVDRSELNEFATKTFVESEIAKAQLGGGDVTEEELTALLSDYYRKDETYSKSEIDAKIPSIEGLATKDDVAAVESKIPDVSNFATKSELEEAINNIEHPSIDFSDYYTKSEVDGLIPEVPTKVSELENDAGYATESFVEEAIAEIELKPGPKGDSAHISATRETDGVIIHYYDGDSSGTTYLYDGRDGKDGTVIYYSTIDTSDDDFSEETRTFTVADFETLAPPTYQMPDLNDLIITKNSDYWRVTVKGSDYVAARLVARGKGEKGESEDLSNYYNKSETENLIAEAVKDIEHPTVDLDGYATEEWVNTQGFLKEHQDLSEYAKKSDLPQPELFVVDYNAPDFAAALDAYNNGKLLLLTNAAPDANGYAVMNYVRDDMITFTKFLTSRSETYGSFNTYYLHCDNTWEVSKEVKLNKVEANVSDVTTTNLTSIKIGKEVYRLPETDLSEYYTKSEVDTKISEIEIPDVSNFVTNDVVNNLLATKAEDIPFTTNKVVTNAIGQFALNDSVKDLTVAQILTKILGLVDYIEPEEPTSLVDKLLLEKTPMYSINNDGELAKVDFRIVSADGAPDQSGFYYVEQDGKTIEGGYQDITIRNDELYYIIALPKEIDYNTMVELQSWDPVDSKWIPAELDLISNPTTVASLCDEVGVDISHIDTEKYTVWAHEGECTGSSLRYIIKEEA